MEGGWAVGGRRGGEQQPLILSTRTKEGITGRVMGEGEGEGRETGKGTGEGGKGGGGDEDDDRGTTVMTHTMMTMFSFHVNCE